MLTVYEEAVRKGVQRPDVGRPVRVAEPPRKGEEPAQQLRHLPQRDKRPKRRREDGCDPPAELQAVQDPRAEHIARRQAVRAQQEDEVRGREVEVDVLEAQEGGEDEATGEEGGAGAGEDEGEEEDAVEEAVVLEVDVVDDEEARGEEDGDCGGVGGAPVLCRRLDEPAGC